MSYICEVSRTFGEMGVNELWKTLTGTNFFYWEINCRRLSWTKTRRLRMSMLGGRRTFGAVRRQWSRCAQ